MAYIKDTDTVYLDGYDLTEYIIDDGHCCLNYEQVISLFPYIAAEYLPDTIIDGILMISKDIVLQNIDD